MRFWLLVLVSIVASGLLSPVVADEILVVTRQDLVTNEVTMKRLENIFLRKTLMNAAGIQWVPLNLSANHPVRLAFSQQLFKKRPEDLESYWNSQYYQGITPPYVVASEEAMLRFIASTPGAIGYILPCHLDDRVQVIFKLNVPETIQDGCPALSP
jgi:hypothetical protein